MQVNEEQRAVLGGWTMALAESARKTAKVATAPRSFESVTEAVDTLLAESWKRDKIRPSAPVDDRTWCRRVYLDLVGRIPTSAELEEFLGARSKSKRAELVDRLLQSDEY